MESGLLLNQNNIIIIKAKDQKEFQKSIPYYNEFMKRYALTTYKKVKNKLLLFVRFLEWRYNKSPLQANTEDIIFFFEHYIEPRNIQRIAKLKWRNILNAYYNYVEEYKTKIEQVAFINPVPSLNLFDFTEREITIDELEREEDVLDDYTIVYRVLNYLYFTNKRLFIIVSLLLYTGARISEICRINLGHIDYNERFFFIERVKSKKNTSRWGVYFFPEFFIGFLKEWVAEIILEDPKTSSLFPSLRGKQHLSTKTPRKQLRELKNELGLKCKVNPHAFRNFINTLRFENNLNIKYRSLLLNQTPQNVNVKNYLKKYNLRKNLQKIYDKTFPFPQFKPKLNLI